MGRRAWVAAIGAALVAMLAVPSAASVDVTPGSYSGPLYSASEKVGDNPRVLTHLLPGMKRNGVRTAVLYFGIESRRDPAFIERVIRKAAGAVVPFFSTGIGEVEVDAWAMAHDDARVRMLVDFAVRNDLAVMLHPRAGASSNCRHWSPTIRTRGSSSTCSPSISSATGSSP